MIKFEMEIRFSSELNPYSDLTHIQQIRVLWLRDIPSPYLSASENARIQSERNRDIMFDRSYFSVKKFLAGEYSDVPVWFGG